MGEEDVIKTFLRQAKQFRALGKVIEKTAKTDEDKFQAKMAIGLAEVCEMLAEEAELESKVIEKLTEIVSEIPEKTKKAVNGA